MNFLIINKISGGTVGDLMERKRSENVVLPAPPVGMSEPDGSETFRQPLQISGVVS